MEINFSHLAQPTGCCRSVKKYFWKMRFFRGRLEKAEINIVRRHQRRSKIRKTINKHVIAGCSFDLRVYSSFVLASEGSMFAYVHRSNWMSCYFLTRSISLYSALVTLDKIKQILLRLNVNLKEIFFWIFSKMMKDFWWVEDMLKRT